MALVGEVVADMPEADPWFSFEDGISDRGMGDMPRHLLRALSGGGFIQRLSRNP